MACLLCPQSLSCTRRVRRFFVNSFKSIEFSRFVTLIILMAYSAFGAGVFLGLERGPDEKNRAEALSSYLSATSELIGQLLNLHHNDSENFTLETLSALIDQHHENIEADEPDVMSHWTFWNCLLFAGTIYTTIGYGNFACETAGGKVFTVVYAIFGIPLALITLNDIGHILMTVMKCIQSVGRSCRRRMCGLSKPIKDVYLTASQQLHKKPPAAEGSIARIDELFLPLGDETTIEEPPDEDDLAISTALLSAVLWIFLCAEIFCIWEGWSFGIAFYFFFISLSTIGLGDVVADDPKHMVITFGLVIAGLAMVSVCINTVQTQMEKLFISIMKTVISDYSRDVASGQDEMNASLGMMQNFQGNPKAKIANMLLSNDKKRIVMQKVETDAEKEGYVIPEIFHNCDPKTGLPDFVSSPKHAIEAEIEEIERRDQDPEGYMHRESPPPRVLGWAQSTQTLVSGRYDYAEMRTQGSQFDFYIETDETAAQTEDGYQERHHSCTNISTQMDLPTNTDQTSQYEAVELCENSCQCDQPASLESGFQTDDTETLDQCWQFAPHVADIGLYTIQVEAADNDSQTAAVYLEDAAVQAVPHEDEASPVSVNVAIQCEIAATSESSTQTDFPDQVPEAEDEIQIEEPELPRAPEMADACEQFCPTMFDLKIQTQITETFENNTQTVVIYLEDSAVQACLSHQDEQETQTNSSYFDLEDFWCQAAAELEDGEIQTSILETEESTSQTMIVEWEDAVAQSSIESADQDNQAGPNWLLNRSLFVQTEATGITRRPSSGAEGFRRYIPGSSGKPEPGRRLSTDWRSLLRSIPSEGQIDLSEMGASTSTDQDMELEEIKEIQEHTAPTAKLNWDPFDGRHVEQRKPVGQLKNFFDAKETKSKLTRQSTSDSLK